MTSVVDTALDDMPDDFVIKPFLMANRAEVRNMWLTEYNEEKIAETFRADGERIGEARGEKKGEIKGTIKTLVNLFKKGLINESSAAETAGMTVEDFRKAEALYCN